LFELALAVAATAGASGLATFAVTGLLRRWMGPAVLLALLGLGLPQSADALLRRSEDVRVAPSERIEGSLLATGERVEVEGVVAGDLIAAAHSVTIRGVVEGNLFAFADELEIEGRVTGSVIAGVERIRVRGRVDGSLYAGTERLEIAEGGAVERGLAIFAQNVNLAGTVGRDVYGMVERFELGGRVGRGLELRAGSLSLGPGARVEGDLVAFLPRGRALEGDAASQVGGELRVEPHWHGRGAGLSRYLEGRFWVWLAIRITAAFLVGIVLHALVPGLFRPAELSAPRSLGIGALVLLGAPVLLALLGLTLVGLPLALLGAFAYVSALYAAGILVAARLGAALLEPETEGARAFGLALLLGLMVLAIGASLPFFGPVVRLLVALGGLGMLAQQLRERFVAARALT
jgi:cytoskeletal protein CcmA (bactofilin family)